MVRSRGAVLKTGWSSKTLNGLPAVILETANPAKFPEEIEKTIGFAPDVPPTMTAAIKLPEDFDRMGADYEKFREYLIQHHAA